MRFASTIRTIAIAGVALALPLPLAAQDCDRSCLEGMVTSYVDALVAGDPSGLPLADTVKVTQDSTAIELGEGLFEEELEASTFRQDYLDTQAQVAASHVSLQHGDETVLLSLALHVEDSRIAGIETLVQRVDAESRFQPTELGRPIRGMNAVVPAGRRMSRADLAATALTYTEGLRIGNFTDGGTPFADEAYRVENGVITAGEGCFGSICGMYDQRVILHQQIVASVIAVDEENSTVLLWMNFGDNGAYGPGDALVTFEGFKVWGGEIHAINAFFRMLPSRTPRYWNSAE